MPQHHAYYIEGSQTLFSELVQHTRLQFNFAAAHDPDIHAEQWEKFGIEDSQKLKERAQLKSVSGRALFILGIASITTEAQQALLKLFEEPQEGVIFVLLVPHGVLLPTIKSRMLQLPENLQFAVQKVLGSPGRPLAKRGGQTRPDYFAQQIADFLKAQQKDRSELIIKLLKEEENQKERVRDFLQALEQELYVRLRKSNIVPDKAVLGGLAEIAKVHSYVGDRSPSLKMLLEHLALSLPKIT